MCTVSSSTCVDGFVQDCTVDSSRDCVSCVKEYLNSNFDERLGFVLFWTTSTCVVLFTTHVICLFQSFAFLRAFFHIQRCIYLQPFYSSGHMFVYVRCKRFYVRRLTSDTHCILDQYFYAPCIAFYAHNTYTTCIISLLCP